jgi:hypothetical protein
MRKTQVGCNCLPAFAQGADEQPLQLINYADIQEQMMMMMMMMMMMI